VPIEQDVPRYFFRHDGAFWAVGYHTSPFLLKNLRGCHYLAYLLRHPHQPVHVLDLVVVGTAQGPHADADTEGLGLHIPQLDHADPVLDRHARRSYRMRLQELLQEREQAEQDNDLGRLGRVREEMEFLTVHLTSTSRMFGTPRSAPTPTERARINVKNSINVALHSIAPKDDQLFRHLRNSVKTRCLLLLRSGPRHRVGVLISLVELQTSYTAVGKLRRSLHATLLRRF